MPAIKEFINQPVALTDDVIRQLKQKHGDQLYLVEVAPEKEAGEPLQFVFKKPDRRVLSATAAAYNRQDYIGATEIMAINCCVWGDEDVLRRDDVLAAVAPHFEEINKVRASTLKNL